MHKLQIRVAILIALAAGLQGCAPSQPAPPAAQEPAKPPPVANQARPPRDPGESVLDQAREANRPKVPTMSVADLAQRIADKKTTYVVELKSSEADPVLAGADVIRPDLVDAWASKVPKSAFVVAYCT